MDLPPLMKNLYRGSYTSAHVLLNLLNELGKRDKMRGLPSILSLLRKEFNKFNNARAQMLDSIYHMTNTLKSHFLRKNVIILSLCTQLCYGRHNVSRKSIYCMALFHSQTRRHMINMVIPILMHLECSLVFNRHKTAGFPPKCNIQKNLL